MAYADPWDPTTPAGSEDRSQGDDRIREMKRALQQRLDTLANFSTSTDPSSDPLILKANTVPTVALQNSAVTAGKIANSAIDSYNKFAPALKGELRYAIEVPFLPTTASVAAGAQASETQTVSGAVVGDTVILVLPDDASAATLKLLMYARVTAADTVTLTVTNNTAGLLAVSQLHDWKLVVLKPLP